MNIVAVDDEEITLNGLVDMLTRAMPNAHIEGYSSPKPLLARVSEGLRVDLLFCDVELCEENGLNLSQQLKAILPDLKVVFVTGYEKYAVEAYSQHAEGYLLKPVSDYDVQEILEHLYSSRKKKVFIQTFGNFDIFVDNLPVHFKRSKSKELLAYLIFKRGTAVTIGELSSVVFAQESEADKKKYIQVLMSELMHTLREYGIDGIVYKAYNSISILARQVDCDYYDFLQNIPEAIDAYSGEFMNCYSWAENTNTMLLAVKSRQ